MRRAVPLSVQLLLTFVGLLVGMAAVLTGAAYTSLRANLETEASRHVSDATRLRDERLTQLFERRQQRAEGFLRSVESLCAEPLDSGRLAWADTCVRPILDDYRKSERALGAVLTYRNRRIQRSGQRIADAPPVDETLAAITRTSEGATEYVMRATRRDSVLTVQFDDEEVVTLFEDASSVGRGGTVFLVDADGNMLAPSAQIASNAGQHVPGRLARCQSELSTFIDVDHRGIKSFQSFRPLRVLGAACIGATLGYDEAVAPAERLRADLAQHAAWFALVGAVVSLVAAQWISAPIRRLAQSARKLQTGTFERPIPVGGPSEVRALGTAFNAMGNDVAELLAREQTARREAEDASRTKDEFLATVSHELRTPLTSVLGWAHMLQADDVPPDRLKHGLAVIERSARAQTQLIEDLLDVSRIVSNGLRVAREPVQLGDVVSAAIEALRPQAAEKQIELRRGNLSPALVLGDAHRLEQVVWNLLWNGIKFTQPSGRVTINLSREGRNVLLSVSDTGVGISSAFLPHVFEWFRQEDARARSQAGLGLGLGIVRHIVQLHGGSVRAESAGLGRGATFIVSLPVHQAATLELPAPKRAEPLPRLVHRLDAARVLVVEDDDEAREVVKTTLERAGASVETVSNGRDARREMMADAPDVLISDIRMPDEDGYALIRALRGAGIDTPAIALTAYARREDVDEARAAGYQIHLAKPVDAARLVDAVATLLRDRNVH